MRPARPPPGPARPSCRPGPAQVVAREPPPDAPLEPVPPVAAVAAAAEAAREVVAAAGPPPAGPQREPGPPAGAAAAAVAVAGPGPEAPVVRYDLSRSSIAGGNGPGHEFKVSDRDPAAINCTGQHSCNRVMQPLRSPGCPPTASAGGCSGARQTPRRGAAPLHARSQSPPERSGRASA